MQFLDPAENGT